MPGDRKAVLVAASTFTKDTSLRDLVAPPHDVEALKAVLANDRVGGFDVTVCKNKTRTEVETEIATMFLHADRDDTLLLYFSTHGVKDDFGQLYFALPETRTDLLPASTIASWWVSQQLAASKAQTKIVLLDCCYSGAFSEALGTKGDETVDAVAEFRGVGRVVITASNSVQYSYEDAEQSLFTKHLVHGLSTGEADLDGDGWIGIDELYNYVHNKVVVEKPQQKPNIAIETEGRVLIARSKVGIRPTALPDEIVTALASPIADIRKGAVNALGSLLEGDARLSAAARAELSARLEDDSSMVRQAAAEALTAAPGGDTPSLPPGQSETSTIKPEKVLETEIAPKPRKSRAPRAPRESKPRRPFPLRILTSARLGRFGAFAAGACGVLLIWDLLFGKWLTVCTFYGDESVQFDCLDHKNHSAVWFTAEAYVVCVLAAIVVALVLYGSFLRGRERKGRSRRRVVRLVTLSLIPVTTLLSITMMQLEVRYTPGTSGWAKGVGAGLLVTVALGVLLAQRLGRRPVPDVAHG